MISIALIGAGRIGRVRAGIIRDAGAAVLSHVVDTDLSCAQGIAQLLAYPVQIDRDWKAAVSDEKVDAVIVSTPTRFHREIAMAALKAGKHVLCEKPLALNVEEARQMSEQAHRVGRVLKTGFNYRHMAHVRKAKEILDSGSLGATYFFRCRFGHGGRPGYENEWCTKKEMSGGGALLEQGIHIFDLVRYFLGEPCQVLSVNERYFWNFRDAEDNGFCILQTGTRQVAQIHVSWTQWVNIFEVEIFGRDGYLRLEGRDGHYGPQKLTWGKRKPDHTRPEQEVFEFAGPDDSWRREWQEFTDMVQMQQSVPVSNDGLRAQLLVESAYESALQKRWIAIPK